MLILVRDNMGSIQKHGLRQPGQSTATEFCFGPGAMRIAITGALTLIQRFGSAANLNIHLHGLVLDGVYCTNAEGAPVFHPAPALTREKLEAGSTAWPLPPLPRATSSAR